MSQSCDTPVCGSLCKTDQELLVDALEEKELSTFLYLLETRNADGDPLANPNHEYGDPHYVTCLALAAKKGLTAFIEALLKNGADPNHKCMQREGKAAIHFAAENGNVNALEALTQHPRTDVNIINKLGQTALHLAAKNISKLHGEECFITLIKQGNADINLKNRAGRTAIYEAVKAGCSKETLQEILNSRQDIDLNADDRKLIIQKYPELENELPQANIVVNAQSLFSDLSCGKYEEFIEKLDKKFVNEASVLPETFLQYACRKGLLEIVKVLLNKDADPNLTTANEIRPPNYIACLGGYFDILKLLMINKASVTLVDGKTLLHAIFKGMASKTEDVDSSNYHACFDYLLNPENKFRIPINIGDEHGHTILHYAVRAEDDYFARKLLLDHGAYIGSLNHFGFSPLNDIDPDTLKTVLDESVKSNKKFRKDMQYELTFKYGFLKPRTELVSSSSLVIEDKENLPLKDEESGISEMSADMPIPEMYPLYQISQSNNLRHLLKHPVLLVFLHMKWNRIKVFFYANLLFYIAFVAFLTTYILHFYDTDAEEKIEGISTAKDDSEANYLSKMVQHGVLVKTFLLILFFFLVLRELFQFVMAKTWCRYFCNLENWLEVGLIIAVVLMFTTEMGNYAKFLAAVALLLSWTELILMLGCIYTLATYNEMMKRVTWNYTKFLAWYSPLIIAFALSFYKLFHESDDDMVMDEKEGDFNANGLKGNFSIKEESLNFFQGIYMSFLKSVVMMIGEFDAGDLPLNYGGHIIFLIFVFMITIVLTNLLNGLAVSDTQAIKNDAEILCYSSKVNLVSHFENVLLGDPLGTPPHTKSSSCFCLRCCCLRIGCQAVSLKCLSYIRRFFSGICLFPDTFTDNNLKIKPNQDGRFIGPIGFHDDEIEYRPDACCTVCNKSVGCHIDNTVLEAAMDIIDDKSRTTDFERLQHEIQNMRMKYEKHVSGVNRELKEVKNNISKILLILKQVADQQTTV